MAEHSVLFVQEPPEEMPVQWLLVHVPPKHSEVELQEPPAAVGVEVVVEETHTPGSTEVLQ